MFVKAILNSNADTYDYREAQNLWFENELKECSSTYCLVFGHHPVFSIGTHGPTSELVNYLKPLMEKYKGTNLNFRNFLIFLYCTV